MKNILTAVALFLVIGLSADANAQQRAADFKLKSADGKMVQLSKLRGKVVVVNFWATWCGPCRKEIPDFIELQKKYEKKGLEIVGVSLDEDGWTKVTPFVKENGINYPVVLGTREVVQSYGSFNAIPTTFIIDKEGNIVDQHTGTLTQRELESKLKSLL